MSSLTVLRVNLSTKQVARQLGPFLTLEAAQQACASEAGQILLWTAGEFHLMAEHQQWLWMIPRRASPVEMGRSGPRVQAPHYGL